MDIKNTFLRYTYFFCFYRQKNYLQYNKIIYNIYKTTRLQDYKTTRLQDYKTTRLQDYKTTRLQDYKTTRLQDITQPLHHHRFQHVPSTSPHSPCSDTYPPHTPAGHKFHSKGTRDRKPHR